MNNFGLLYTWEGTDTTSPPILLLAHQDVVPVEDEALANWEYPPLRGHYDDENYEIWGRGSIGGKGDLIAILAALDGLITSGFSPKRSVILAFGFDEELGGREGASQIAKVLDTQYDGGMAAVFLDNTAAVAPENVGDVMYALPAMYEKGYMDV